MVILDLKSYYNLLQNYRTNRMELASFRRTCKLIGYFMIISMFCRFINLIHDGHLSDLSSYCFTDSYGFTEFLINFRGGFVRRGLFGEILLWFTTVTGINILATVVFVSFISYFLVLYFFIKKFNEKGYCWWLIFSVLLCGYTIDIIRKDFILYGLTISVFILICNSNPSLWRRYMAVAIAIFGLFLHEAYMFFGIPILFLILWQDQKHRYSNIALISLIILAFAILCAHKGNEEIANSIINSWKTACPNLNLFFNYDNSIGALSWPLFQTVKFHISKNIGIQYHLLGIPFWCLLYIVIYYFITFFLQAFHKKSDFDDGTRNSLSSCFLIISFCMLPMFTMLSCDYARLFQYISITSFSAVLILSPEVINGILPLKLVSFSKNLNDKLMTYFPINKSIMILILLTMGISPSTFDLNLCFEQSPIGITFRTVHVFFTTIICQLQIIQIC